MRDNLVAFGPDGPALHRHLEWSLYSEIGVASARAAILAVSRGDCDRVIEGRPAALIVPVLGLEAFVAARYAGDSN